MQLPLSQSEYMRTLTYGSPPCEQNLKKSVENILNFASRVTEQGIHVKVAKEHVL